MGDVLETMKQSSGRLLLSPLLARRTRTKGQLHAKSPSFVLEANRPGSQHLHRCIIYSGMDDMTREAAFHCIH